MTRQEAQQMVLNEIETWSHQKMFEYIAEHTLRDIRYLPDYALEAEVKELTGKDCKID